MSRLHRFAARHMFLVAGGVIGGRYLVGDALVQAVQGYENGRFKKDWLDLRRSMSFGAFGAAYAPLGVLFYNKLYPFLLGARPFLTAMVDVTTQGPFLYFPMYYVCKEMVFAEPEELKGDVVGVARRGLAHYSHNFWDDMKLYWSVWIPFHVMNFKFFSKAARMPVMAAQGLFWVAALSVLRGGKQTVTDEDEDDTTSTTTAVRQPVVVNVNVTRAVMPGSFVAPHVQQAAEAARGVAARAHEAARSSKPSHLPEV